MDSSAAAGAAGSSGNGMRLRLARQARGFSQQQLAGMAGVSRQAVSAVESGLSDPSLRVALALARALGLSVEEMFGPGTRIPAVAARPLAPLGAAGSRVILAPVGDELVALPLAGAAVTRAGFVSAGGIANGISQGPAEGAGRALPDDVSQASAGGAGRALPDDLSQASAGGAGRALPDDVSQAPAGGVGRALPGRALPDRALPDSAGPSGAGPAASRSRHAVRSVQPIGPPRPTLVVAGCDPALPLLEVPLSLLDPPIAFAWWPCSSEEALELAADGLVHVAGAHLLGSSGDYNTGPAGELLRNGAEVIGFCSWREGLVLRSERSADITRIEDLLLANLRLVNREPGSEARRVLDRELTSRGIDPGQVDGYQTRATGHLHVAATIAAGLADAGVASEPAALAYGLGFVPLASERFDLVIPAAQASSREVQGLLKVLSSRWLLDQLASLPGYDPSHCGERIATLGPAAGRR